MGHNAGANTAHTAPPLHACLSLPFPIPHTSHPHRALSMWYNDREGWRKLTARAMRMDWSWFSPALDYIELYYKAIRS